jgi:hypothetical protein
MCERTAPGNVRSGFGHALAAKSRLALFLVELGFHGRLDLFVKS